MEKAVQLGEEALIFSLDKVINPILEDILCYRAASTDELRKQLSFIADLLARRSDDAATVARLAAKISEITTSYFQDTQQRLRDLVGGEQVTAPAPAASPMPVNGPNLPIARVAVVSMEYRMLYCYSDMADGLQIPLKELIGRPLTDFCSADLFESAYRTNLELCLAGEFREFEAPWLTGRADSPRFRVRLTPLRNIERRIAGAVLVAQVDDAIDVEHIAVPAAAATADAIHGLI